MDGAEPGRIAAPAADRRPSITRLATSLRHSLAMSGRSTPEAEALCLPAALLFARHLRFDAADPLWRDRDRLVLTSGAAPLGEAAAALLGSGDGLVQVSTQAVGCATGLALAERMLAGRFGRSLVDHRSWVLGGGGELATGQVQEAAYLAGAWRLGRVTIIAAVASPDAPGLAGFAANGWAVRRVDAGDAGEIAASMSAAIRSFKPTLIACIGGAADGLGNTDEPGLDTPAGWVAAGSRGAGVRRAWLKRVARHAARQDFDFAMAGRLPPRWAPLAGAGPEHPPGHAGEPDTSSAQAVRRALAELSKAVPGLTTLPGEPAPCGELVQASAAALSGMAVHGGLVPWMVHRLDAVERIRPALAEAALAGQRLLHVLVEPEDPCPIAGRRAGLRAMRNVTVFRPADASDSLECLELALRHVGGPSVLLLSEQPVAAAASRPAKARSASGGYVVAEAVGPREVTLVASGPEVALALAVRSRLHAGGVRACVVALPCWTLFAAQDPPFQAAVLGQAPRIGLEPGSGFGWERWLGPAGLFIGLGDASGPAHGDLPVQARSVSDAVLRHLGRLQAI